MQVGYAEIAILSLYLASLPAVKAATGQVLSTRLPVDHGHHPAPSCDTSLVVSGGVDCGRRRRNVYEKKPRRYAKDNRTAHLTARSDRAYVTNNISSSAVAKRPRDASCLLVVSFNSTKRRIESFIVSYVGYIFVTVCSYMR